MPTTLFTWVNTACLRSIMEYGAERCSAKWTTASGSKSLDDRTRGTRSRVMSPTKDSMVLPVSCFQTRRRSAQRTDRRQGLRAQFMIPLPANEVVDDGDRMPCLERYSAVAQPQ